MAEISPSPAGAIPEPWPDWLARLTPEERVLTIVPAVANCYSAPSGPGHDDAHDGPHCTALMAAQFLLRLLGEAAQAPSADPHAYLSTPCLHASEPGREHLHGYCQSAAGFVAGVATWPKTPAACKFCEAPCTCRCHHDEMPDGTQEAGTPEPWPHWLKGLTPEQRVLAIVRAHAHWCHGADDFPHPGAGAAGLLLRLLSEAGQAPVASPSLTEVQVAQAVAALRRLSLEDPMTPIDDDGDARNPAAELSARRSHAAGALETIQRLAGEYQPEPGADPEPEPEPVAAPPLPPGDYGRIEIPGFRNHTGWWTDGVMAGQPVMICRDRDGSVLARYIPGPGFRFLDLPVPSVTAESGPQAIDWGAADPDDDPDDYAAHAIGCHDDDCDGECQDGAPF